MSSALPSRSARKRYTAAGATRAPKEEEERKFNSPTTRYNNSSTGPLIRKETEILPAAGFLICEAKPALERKRVSYERGRCCCCTATFQKKGYFYLVVLMMWNATRLHTFAQGVGGDRPPFSAPACPRGGVTPGNPTCLCGPPVLLLQHARRSARSSNREGKFPQAKGTYIAICNRVIKKNVLNLQNSSGWIHVYIPKRQIVLVIITIAASDN